jgi:hypothetical protein
MAGEGILTMIRMPILSRGNLEAAIYVAWFKIPQQKITAVDDPQSTLCYRRVRWRVCACCCGHMFYRSQVFQMHDAILLLARLPRAASISHALLCAR